MSKVRVGVLGGYRGFALFREVSHIPEAEIVSICDKDPRAIRVAQERAEKELGIYGVKYYSDFEEFFNSDMDAVVLANYANEHAPYAIRFLRSGRHVLSECLTMTTMQQAVELIEAVEESGMIYNYAENYCFTPVRLEMKRLFENGDLGAMMYAEGEYLHDCSGLWPMITYGDRHHWRNNMPSTFYCTHSVGPILYMTGARPVQVSAFETPNMPFMRELGTASGTLAMEVITLDNGAFMKSLHFNIKSNRESNYQLNGDLGGCQEIDGDRISVYLEKPGQTGKGERKIYKPEPLLPESELSGHGGGDFYTTYYFIHSILGDEDAKKRAIGVYQAVDMCMPGTLGYRSIVNGNAPVKVPDLRNKAERDAYRNDTFCTFPEIAGDQYVSNNIHNPEPIPDETYEKVKNMWDNWQIENDKKRAAKLAEAGR